MGGQKNRHHAGTFRNDVARVLGIAATAMERVRLILIGHWC